MVACFNHDFLFFFSSILGVKKCQTCSFIYLFGSSVKIIPFCQENIYDKLVYLQASDNADIVLSKYYKSAGNSLFALLCRCNLGSAFLHGFGRYACPVSGDSSVGRPGWASDFSLVRYSRQKTTKKKQEWNSWKAIRASRKQRKH